MTQWWREGERRLGELVAALGDDDFAGTTLLPNWDRSTLVAHLARNADALRNLVRWARTGIETPMYASPDERVEGIRTSATQSPAELRADLAVAAQLLLAAADEVTDEQWDVEVRTAQGRTVPAREITWMRAKECWVHAADLDVGVGLDAAPDGFLLALVDDVTATWQRRGDAVDLTLVAAGKTWALGAGSGPVELPLAAAAGLVTGRVPVAGVAVPRWL